MRLLTLAAGLILEAVCLATPAAFAQPLTTAFTYQGDLRAAGVPASGTHDLRFRLYDAAAWGAQVGATLCSDDVLVSEGRFTVQLDFGAQFTGQQRFLEIEVRVDTGLNCSNLAGFTTLGPRQALTAAPNAAFALNAATATTATSAATATTATTASNATQLNGQGAAFYQNAANLSAGTLPGARLAGSYPNALTLNNAANAFTGIFSGTGSGLTGLNASSIASGTLDAARLPIPLSLTGSSPYALIGGTNVSTSGRGVFGFASATTGTTYGVHGRSDSTDGSGVFGEATASAGVAFGGRFQSASPGGRGVFANASHPTGMTVGGEFWNTSTSGIGVSGWSFGTSGETYGGWFRAESTEGRAVFGRANAPTGLNWGGYFESVSTNGRGVQGVATAASGSTFGGRFESASPDGRGVQGMATATSGETYGGRFETFSPTGTAVAGFAYGGGDGVYGESGSASGRGVFGLAYAATGTTYGGRFLSRSTSGVGVLGEATAATGLTYGVFGQSSSTSGVGVLAEATSLTGLTRGVHGRAASTSGYGVFAEATSLTGLTVGVYGRAASTSGYGVFGWATAGSGTTYGVYGESASAAGYGVWASGRLGASGTKSFCIDHPEDPENKYLLHYSSESPEVINFYRGTVMLDNAGEVIVELPAYFARVNKSPSYTLTAVGAPMPMLHVAEEIDEGALLAGEKAAPGDAVPICSFRIAGGVAGAKVSWRIEAVRNDLWMRNRAAPVEADKLGLEKGMYQHPEFYGQPKERGMNYAPEREAVRTTKDRSVAPR